MKTLEELFHQIVNKIPNAVEAKMFGAMSIKINTGKTAAFFWDDNMVFKLDESSQQEALKLEGANIGSHIYAPEKQMKGRVSIPAKHVGKWQEFSEKAVLFVGTI